MPLVAGEFDFGQEVADEFDFGQEALGLQLYHSPIPCWVSDFGHEKLGLATETFPLRRPHVEHGTASAVGKKDVAFIPLSRTASASTTTGSRTSSAECHSDEHDFWREMSDEFAACRSDERGFCRNVNDEFRQDKRGRAFNYDVGVNSNSEGSPKDCDYIDLDGAVYAEMPEPWSAREFDDTILPTCNASVAPSLGSPTLLEPRICRQASLTVGRIDTVIIKKLFL